MNNWQEELVRERERETTAGISFKAPNKCTLSAYYGRVLQAIEDRADNQSKFASPRAWKNDFIYQNSFGFRRLRKRFNQSANSAG